MLLELLRTLILSDIHSNLEALTAVIDDATERGGFDNIWCLGDIVGYGPDPGACIKLLRQHEVVAVAGNHVSVHRIVEYWPTVHTRTLPTEFFTLPEECACWLTEYIDDVGAYNWTELLMASVEPAVGG